MKKYLLIINPRAGSARAIEDDLVVFFQKRRVQLDVVKTKGPLDARRLAKKAVGRYSVVIAAGGDGTVNEVINGLALSDVKFGIIPAGTENALAAGLGIPFNHMAAARVVARGRVKTLDLGKARRRYFILTAGVGLDAKALNDVQPDLKKLLGKHVYPLQAAGTILTHVPAKLEVWIDDQVLPRWGYFVMVANVKWYGANMEIAQYAKPDDGYLDVCIFKKTDVLSMFKYFVSASSKGAIPLTEFSGIEYFKAKKVVVKSKKKVLAHTDAEMIGTTPVTFTAVPKGIKVIC
ncbi:diacylglycerol kinase family lipid kinase [Candidatus Woesearchaeota archaeon]|nr:diacylglycerol kinase family lipid kinase [Candidatus Woesearchaeota archaeon]